MRKMTKTTMNLPKQTGFYLWYILDLSYMKVGLVHVVEDPPLHLNYLRSRTKDQSKDFYLYPTGWEGSMTYTMYHQAHDHLPPADENNKPLVDGYIPFDFRTVGLIPAPPIKL